MNARETRGLSVLRVPEGGLTGEWLGPIERAFVANGVSGVRGGGNGSRFIGKALNKTGLMRSLVRTSTDATIVQLVHLSAYRAFPSGLWREIIPDCFDCWEPDYPRWESLFRRMHVKTAFFSARQSAMHMRQAVAGLDTIWAPEGIDASLFKADKPLAERRIDVLELGRKHDSYHQSIEPHCVANGYAHLFEKIKGSIVFASRIDMLAGLADTRISVCFPSSLTHPERSGNVETMTQRYLESIASGTILLGKCPSELVDLFGFDPVIEIDQRDPTGQLDHILSNLPQFADLTKRSARRLREVGTLQYRTARMLAALGERGFRSYDNAPMRGDEL